MAEIYTDGFTIGKNPSREGGGCVITNEFGQVLAKDRILKNNFTNNEAELLGIYWATRIANKYDEIFTDSFCALHWAKNGKCKTRPDLNELARQCRENIDNKKLQLIQIPREENQAGFYIEEFIYGNE